MKTKRQLLPIQPFDDHQQKLQRAIASRQTRISVAIIAHFALELSRQSDNTIQNFDRWFAYAFDLLTQADQKLFTLHSQQVSEPSNGVSKLSETTETVA